MSVSKEFLLEAVGMSLMVALLLVGFQVFQKTNVFVTAMERKQEQRMEAWEEYEVVQYDGRTIDGITAVSYIKNVVGQYRIPVYVETAENDFLVAGTGECAGLRDLTSAYYIDTLTLYRCSVIRNENDSIAKVEIRVQREENENE